MGGERHAATATTRSVAAADVAVYNVGGEHEFSIYNDDDRRSVDLRKIG